LWGWPPTKKAGAPKDARQPHKRIYCTGIATELEVDVPCVSTIAELPVTPAGTV